MSGNEAVTSRLVTGILETVPAWTISALKVATAFANSANKIMHGFEILTASKFPNALA